MKRDEELTTNKKAEYEIVSKSLYYVLEKANPELRNKVIGTILDAASEIILK